MSTPSTTNVGVPLDDLFRRSFAPRCLSDRGKDYSRSYLSAVRSLGQFLGRVASTADLSRETLVAWQAAVIAAGVNRTTVQHYKARLNAIGHHARRLGLIDFVSAPVAEDLRLVEALPPAAEGTLRYFFETEFRTARLVGVTAGRIEEYRSTFRMLHLHHGRDLRFEEHVDALAGEHLAWLLARGIRAITVNTKHRSAWFAVWREAVARDLIAKPPTVKRLRVVRDEPDAWTEDETRRIVEAAAAYNWPRPVAGIPAGLWWRAMLLATYWTGLRKGSVLKLRPGDVDLQTGWLTISGDRIKNKRGKRLRLGADAIEAIKQIYAPSRDRLFPWPYDQTHFARCFNLITDAAGVPRSSRAALTQMHKLRRTTATITAVRRGISAAAELLGHSSEEVTQRYIDSSKMPDRDATEFLPMLGGPRPEVQETRS